MEGLNRFDDVFGGESSHNQCLLTVSRHLHWSSINPLHILRHPKPATIHFHHKFEYLHYFFLHLRRLEPREHFYLSYSHFYHCFMAYVSPSVNLRCLRVFSLPTLMLVGLGLASAFPDQSSGRD